jgi:hypothetical protein
LMRRMIFWKKKRLTNKMMKRALMRRIWTNLTKMTKRILMRTISKI